MSEGITELDNADGYRDTLRRLREAYFNEIDAFLVERIALCMVRLRRTRGLKQNWSQASCTRPLMEKASLQIQPLNAL